MRRVSQIIRTQYITYRDILDIHKVLTVNEVNVSSLNSNNVGYRKGDCGFISDRYPPGQFYIKRKIDEDSYYDFVVRIDQFSTHALCRFDSDGHTHTNKDPSIPLVEQQISTPHFHRWSEKGKEIAYKTTDLITFEKEIYEDINVGLSLFCEEFKLFSKSGYKPTIVTYYSLFPELSVIDLHSGVQFE